MSFDSISKILKKVDSENKPFWQIILEDDMNERRVSSKESIDKMALLYNAMKNADSSYDGNLKSASGLVGGEGEKIRIALEKGTLMCGNFIGTVMERALKMGESNACMKRIIAAPTAGSCGVIPAVLLTYQEFFNVPEEKMLEGLYVASGLGEVIALRASIAGATGGCQAEIGSASAMAAGAIAYLNGGNGEEIAHACALAIKGLLGLVCDPVAGLVEVPCVKRNVIGAVNAITSADMALAGIRSKIPPDEVIDAMKEVGDLLPPSLRETSKAGLAVTPTGIKITEDIIK